MGRLASDDDRPVPGRRRKAAQVTWVAGQDAVTWRGEEHDGGIDRVGGTRHGQQRASVAAVPMAHCAHLDGAQQPGQAGLPAVLVTPYLGDHHRVSPKVQPVLLRRLEPGYGRPFITIDGYQCASVEDQCAHTAVSLARCYGGEVDVAR